MLIHKARNLSSGEDNNWILRRKNKHGNTALHEAVLTRDACLVSHLLSIYLEPVYWENADRKSPLYLALNTGNSNIFQILLSYSLDPSRIEGLPPVHGAIARGQYGLLREILKKDMKLFAMKDSKDNNVFHLATLLNKLRVFELLGPETEYLAREENMNGDLPIHVASKRGHVALINKLHGVSPWLNGQGQTVLHVAAKYGRASTVRCILRHLDLGMLINERDDAGNTALHLAAIFSQPAALISLVWDERIDLFLLDYKGLTAFDIALDHVRRKYSFRKWLAAMVLESASDESRDLFVQRPEAQDQAHSTSDVQRSKPNPKLNKEAINTRLVVAALVATVTFTAGFTVPGGFNGWDTASKEERGVAVMLDKRMFQVFAICNTIAMFCSMIAVIHLMMAQHSDYDKAIAARYHAMALLKIALLAMSIVFLTGVTLTIAKLPWLANTIFYSGLIFLLLISCAVSSEYPPFFRIRCRPIRLLMLRLGLAYINWWQVYTYLLDDSKENSKAGGTSANGHLDGATESDD
ncbi:hypothetical protein BT93_L1993 [Corymbia citriodora subsp. variegata]|uniref:PGG domain-containing protein n=1 Tax=Corymbia citriodora subsp. variegata TaxID=360336 RepID=A0A8T0CLA1_CORYI|nr:hypothetical protein BT93_L1993 [Corymbia citriodora subsp. variegata]